MKTKSTSFGFKQQFINEAFIEHLLYTEYSTKCYWKNLRKQTSSTVFSAFWNLCYNLTCWLWVLCKGYRLSASRGLHII